MFGEYLFYYSNKLYLYRFLNICIFAITLFFILLNLSRIEGEKYIKTIESAITIIHVSKYNTYTYKTRINQ